MNLEQRVGKIEEAIFGNEKFDFSHDERLKNYFRALHKYTEEFNFKINVLIDVQMRNESEIRKLREAWQSRLKRIGKIENK